MEDQVRKGEDKVKEWRRIGYTKVLMDHFLHPRNVGELENPTVSVMVGSVACGDMIKMDMRIEAGKIVDVKFKSYGCAANVATASVATEYVKGKRVEELREFSFEKIVEMLGGLPRSKMHCAALANMAIKACVAKYEVKEGRRKLDRGVLSLLLSGVIDPKTGEPAISEGKVNIRKIDGKKVEIEVKEEDPEVKEDLMEQIKNSLKDMGVEISFF